MSSSNVVREAQSVETYEASAKQKAAAKLSRIPVKVCLLYTSPSPRD